MPRVITARQTQYLLDEFNSYFGVDPDYQEEINSLKNEINKDAGLKENEWVKRFMDELSGFQERAKNNITNEERTNDPTGHKVNNPKDIAKLMYYYFQADSRIPLADKCPTLDAFFRKRYPVMETFLYIKPKSGSVQNVNALLDSDDSIEVPDFGYYAVVGKHTQEIAERYKPEGRSSVDAGDKFDQCMSDVNFFVGDNNVRSRTLEKILEQNVMDPKDMVSDFLTGAKATWDKMPKTAWWHKKPSPESDFGQMQTAYTELLSEMKRMHDGGVKDVDFPALKEKLEALKGKSMAYIDAKDDQKGIDKNADQQTRKNANAGARTKFGQDRYNAAWSLNDFCDKALAELENKVFQNEQFKSVANELVQVKKQEKEEKKYWDEFEKKEEEFKKTDIYQKKYKPNANYMEKASSSLSHLDPRLYEAQLIRKRYTDLIEADIKRRVDQYVKNNKTKEIKELENELEEINRQIDQNNNKIEFYEGKKESTDAFKDDNKELERQAGKINKELTIKYTGLRNQYYSSKNRNQREKDIRNAEDKVFPLYYEDNKTKYPDRDRARSEFNYTVGSWVETQKDELLTAWKDQDKFGDNMKSNRKDHFPSRDFGAERKKEIKSVRNVDKEFMNSIKGVTNEAIVHARRKPRVKVADKKMTM